MPAKSVGRDAYRKAVKKYVIEKKSIRGLVPAKGSGIVDEPYEAYLSELNPRGDDEAAIALRLSLATAKDPRFQAFLERLSLPQFSRYRLSTIAKGCDISLPEFAGFWQSSQHMRVLLKAQSATVDVIDDISADAKSQFILCERCDGFGTLFLSDGDKEMLSSEEKIRVCPACSGEGKVRRPGDADARKMLLEIAGHIGGKKNAPSISINQHFGSIESSVDRMRSVTFDVSAIDSEEPA